MVAPLEKVVPLNDPLPLVDGLYVIGSAVAAVFWGVTIDSSYDFSSFCSVLENSFDGGG